MKSNFAESLRLVGISEGGYQKFAADSGNYCGGKLIGTNHGIAAPTLKQWLGRCPTESEMRNLPKATADAIYKARFWDTLRGDQLPKGVDYAVFDYGVNSGVGRAAKDLQAVVGTTQDGIVGPITLRAVERFHPQSLINALCDRRMSFLQRLRDWNTWGRGWTNRVRMVRANALRMASAPTS